MAECKCCGAEVPDSFFIPEYEICFTCGNELDAWMNVAPGKLAEFQDAANNSTDPNSKIRNLKLMLSLLYDYKVKFYDKGVEAIEQDVDDLIDDVIDAISYART